MTLIQAFLRGPGSTDEKLLELKTKFGIIHRRHGVHANLCLLKYNQIESPFGEPIVRECRGIILDEASDWAIVSRAFNKFFNHGEGHAAALDWSTAKVQEKVDGSLCVVYPYSGQWHVATSGTPDASGDVNGSGRFSEYFWRTYEETADELLMGPVYPCCFFFELSGPANRIVVVHEKPSLTCLGGRNLETGVEIFVEEASERTGIRAVREFPLQSFEDIAASFSTISPLKQEGYVVVDSAFNRVKVNTLGTSRSTMPRTA